MHDAAENQEIDQGDAEEEEGGDGGSEDVPDAFESVKAGLDAPAVIAMANESKMTMVECPTEKKKPTSMGRLPSCINFRVTLSMAEM